MRKGYTRPAVEADLPVVASKMRSADVAEIKASSNSKPLDALREGFRAGPVMTICLPCGTPAGIYGVYPVNPGVGSIWMLATEDLKQIHRQFIRECRGCIREVTKGFDLVFNYVDVRNTLHLRWIKWSGFTVINIHPQFGHERRPFAEFVKITREDSYV